MKARGDCLSSFSPPTFFPVLPTGKQTGVLIGEERNPEGVGRSVDGCEDAVFAERYLGRLRIEVVGRS